MNSQSTFSKVAAVGTVLALTCMSTPAFAANAATAKPVAAKVVHQSLFSALRQQLLATALTFTLPAQTASAISGVLAQYDDYGGDTGYDNPGTYDSYNQPYYEASYAGDTGYDAPGTYDTNQNQNTLWDMNTDSADYRTLECSTANGCIGGTDSQYQNLPYILNDTNGGVNGFDSWSVPTGISDYPTFNGGVSDTNTGDAGTSWFTPDAYTNAGPDETNWYSGITNGISETTNTFIDGVQSALGFGDTTDGSQGGITNGSAFEGQFTQDGNGQGNGFTFDNTNMVDNGQNSVGSFDFAGGITGGITNFVTGIDDTIFGRDVLGNNGTNFTDNSQGGITNGSAFEGQYTEDGTSQGGITNGSAFEGQFTQDAGNQGSVTNGSAFEGQFTQDSNSPDASGPSFYDRAIEATKSAFGFGDQTPGGPGIDSVAPLFPNFGGLTDNQNGNTTGGSAFEGQFTQDIGGASGNGNANTVEQNPDETNGISRATLTDEQLRDMQGRQELQDQLNRNEAEQNRQAADANRTQGDADLNGYNGTRTAGNEPGRTAGDADLNGYNGTAKTADKGDGTRTGGDADLNGYNGTTPPGTTPPGSGETTKTVTTQQPAAQNPQAYQSYLFDNKVAAQYQGGAVTNETYKNDVLKPQYEQIVKAAGPGANLPSFDNLSDSQLQGLKNRIESVNGNVGSLATLPVQTQVRVPSSAPSPTTNVPNPMSNGDSNLGQGGMNGGATQSAGNTVNGQLNTYNQETQKSWYDGTLNVVKSEFDSVKNTVSCYFGTCPPVNPLDDTKAGSPTTQTTSLENQLNRNEQQTQAEIAKANDSNPGPVPSSNPQDSIVDANNKAAEPGRLAQQQAIRDANGVTDTAAPVPQQTAQPVQPTVQSVWNAATDLVEQYPILKYTGGGVVVTTVNSVSSAYNTVTEWAQPYITWRNSLFR